MGNTAQAKKILQQALLSSPSDSDILCEYADLCAFETDFEESINTNRRVLLISPNNSPREVCDFSPLSWRCGVPWLFPALHPRIARRQRLEKIEERMGVVERVEHKAEYYQVANRLELEETIQEFTHDSEGC